MPGDTLSMGKKSTNFGELESPNLGRGPDRPPIRDEQTFSSHKEEEPLNFEEIVLESNEIDLAEL